MLSVLYFLAMASFQENNIRDSLLIIKTSSYILPAKFYFCALDMTTSCFLIPDQSLKKNVDVNLISG